MKDGIIYRKPRLIKKMQVQLSLMKLESKNEKHVVIPVHGMGGSATRLLPSQFFKIT
jgi:hypothetical protein